MSAEGNPHNGESPLGDQGGNLSIIIPTFNCAEYLRKALATLMEQPPGSLERAQIMVVDDCSTRDDPEAVVREMASGRVGFHRHERNIGPCANLNFCLEYAEREWIQILHGDDYMLPGAYEEFARCLELFPEALAVFARSQIMTWDDQFHSESEPLGSEERCWLTYDPMMWARNLIYPAGVLLNRRVLELVGKFDCTFTHVNDWNYWWRLARTGRCVYTRACIAAYRVSEAGHTATLVRSGTNVAEGMEQVERLFASFVEEKNGVPIARDQLFEGVYATALFQCSKFIGEREPFAANWRLLRRMPARFLWRKRGALAQLWWRHLHKLVRHPGVET